jgi:hypothetical protein
MEAINVRSSPMPCAQRRGPFRRKLAVEGVEEVEEIVNGTGAPSLCAGEERRPAEVRRGNASNATKDNEEKREEKK